MVKIVLMALGVIGYTIVLKLVRKYSAFVTPDIVAGGEVKYVDKLPIVDMVKSWIDK
jgi:hypothetical protein